eukprot:COSAG01_NODE_629_length_14689_cov_298.955517_4_plen_118_part_00
MPAPALHASQAAGMHRLGTRRSPARSPRMFWGALTCGIATVLSYVLRFLTVPMPISQAQSRQVAAALDLLSAVEAPPPPHVCVQLLDARFPHSAVRLFATHGGWALPQPSFPGMLPV